jgi:hypothetical protein
MPPPQYNFDIITRNSAEKLRSAFREEENRL